MIVTNHDRIVGWFMPASRPKRVDQGDSSQPSDDVRRSAEASGVDVGARMKELGLEDEYLFEDPWVEARPAKPIRKSILLDANILVSAIMGVQTKRDPRGCDLNEA